MRDVIAAAQRRKTDSGEQGVIRAGFFFCFLSCKNPSSTLEIDEHDPMADEAADVARSQDPGALSE